MGPPGKTEQRTADGYIIQEEVLSHADSLPLARGVLPSFRVCHLVLLPA